MMVTPVDLRVELQLGGTWTDVSTDVYDRGQVRISRGQSSEGARADHSRLTLQLNNRNGQFSPRNPRSPYYGQVGRNTPIRVSVPGPTYVDTTAGHITTPDHASLDITGDLDIRIDADLITWWADLDLAAKYTSAGDQRSWLLVCQSDGTLSLYWSPTGTLASRISCRSTAPVPVVGGRRAVRVTLDVDNGASGHTATFWTAPSMAGPWEQLGDPVTVAGTTSIYSSSAPLQVGEVTDSSFSVPSGRIWGFELRNGIGGAVVADPGIAARSAGDTSWTGADGRTWSTGGGSILNDRDYRFWGEVASWPTRWDTTGRDVYTPISAAGVMRRLEQGAPALMSTLRRGTLAQAALIAYWPAEDGASSEQVASALEGGTPMTVEIEQPDYASFDRFACSMPLPIARNSQWYGVVPAYTSTQHQARFLFYIEDGVNNERIFTVYCSGGGVQRVALHYATGGSTWLRIYGWGEVLLHESLMGTGLDARLLRLSVELTQDGADIDVRISTLEVGASVGLFWAYTVAGQTVGRISGVGTNAGGGLSTTTAVFGHIAVYRETTNLFDLSNQLDGYEGETAGYRLMRLCGERGIPLQLIGEPGDTEKLASQRPDTFMSLIRAAADVDMGLLYEPRDRPGIAYRTRASLYNQPAALEMQYGASSELTSLEPIDDDSQTRNAVTVTRVGGSSATAVLEDGPLSVRSPDDPAPGVGEYEDAVTLPLLTDDQLPGQAGWRLHVGTVDEARYPTIPLQLREHSGTVPATVAAGRALDVGHRLTITDPPTTLPPEAIDQLAVGTVEVLTGHVYTTTANATPYSPYRVGVLDDDVLGRADTAGSILAAGVGPSDTSLVVATTSGPEWVWEPGTEFPFSVRVGGEVMEVTSVSGPSWTMGDLSRWTAIGCTFVQSTTRAYLSAYSGLLTVVGTPSLAYVRPLSAHRAYVTPGVTYTASLWVWSASSRAVQAAIDWFDGAGNYLSTDAAAKTVPASTWTRLSVSAAAPVGAARGAYGPTLAGSPPTGAQIWVSADPVAFWPIERQAFTVTRSINGISKSHSAGVDVRLDQPMIVSL